MNNFSYTRATDVASAVREVASDHAASFIAGGTNLIDLMKENVAQAQSSRGHHSPSAQSHRDCSTTEACASARW